MSSVSTPSSSVVQLLAVCPMVAVSDTLLNALALGVSVLLIVPLSAALMYCVGRWLGDENSLAASLLITAAVTAAVELLLSAWLPQLRESLTVFLPLLAANVILVEHVRASCTPGAVAALRASVARSASTGSVLLALGAARELVGHGSLLHDAPRVLGGWAEPLQLEVLRTDTGFLLAMLTPGAFIALGLLLAARNRLTQRHRP